MYPSLRACILAVCLVALLGAPTLGQTIDPSATATALSGTDITYTDGGLMNPFVQLTLYNGDLELILNSMYFNATDSTGEPATLKATGSPVYTDESLSTSLTLTLPDKDQADIELSATFLNGTTTITQSLTNPKRQDISFQAPGGALALSLDCSPYDSHWGSPENFTLAFALGGVKSGLTNDDIVTRVNFPTASTTTYYVPLNGTVPTANMIPVAIITTFNLGLTDTGSAAVQTAVGVVDFLDDMVIFGFLSPSWTTQFQFSSPVIAIGQVAIVGGGGGGGGGGSVNGGYGALPGATSSLDGIAGNIVAGTITIGLSQVVGAVVTDVADQSVTYINNIQVNKTSATLTVGGASGTQSTYSSINGYTASQQTGYANGQPVYSSIYVPPNAIKFSINLQGNTNGQTITLNYTISGVLKGGSVTKTVNATDGTIIYSIDLPASATVANPVAVIALFPTAYIDASNAATRASKAISSSVVNNGDGTATLSLVLPAFTVSIDYDPQLNGGVKGGGGSASALSSFAMASFEQAASLVF